MQQDGDSRRRATASARAVVGARIRVRRKSLGLTQAALAREVGISASYLNLIEQNKRGVAGPLLRRVAEALGEPLEALDGAAERQLLEAVEAVAQSAPLRELAVEADRGPEIIARYPGWARAIVALSQGEQRAAESARALADRLTHDPFLGDSVHRLLTQVAAVRSPAEILAEFDDIEPERRERFNRIILEQVRALSSVAEGLAAYFDKAVETDRRLTPPEEVEALFAASGNRFEALEDAAAGHASRLSADTAAERDAQAEELAERACADRVDALVGAAPELETAPARARARQALLRYVADAMLAPLAAFAPRAERAGYDAELLAEVFRVGFDVACRRLTALPRAEGVPRFGYFQANVAGSLIEVRGLPGLSYPRYAAGCPLWVLFRAQAAPGTVLRQRAGFPSGARFLLIARARRAFPTRPGTAVPCITDMLALAEAETDETAYGPVAALDVEDVGPACRTCPRSHCAHRVEDPLTA